MAYADFSFSKVKKLFRLKTVENEPAIPYNSIDRDRVIDLEKIINENSPLATAIGTDKARSSLLITPVLVEVRKLLGRQISLFIGTEFNVDRELGLTGICDYILSLSPEQYIVESPILMLAESQDADLNPSMGRVIAKMVAAQKFTQRVYTPLRGALGNQQRQNQISYVYGCVSSGTQWQFLRLEGRTLVIDPVSRDLKPIEALVGSILQIFQD